MKDLTGQRFGRLTAICPTTQRKNGGIVWECKCDCGNTVFADTRILRSGDVKSCGCLKKEQAAQRIAERTKELAGQRFGRLTIVRPTEKREGTSVVWECLCDCGNTTYASLFTLRRGTKKSCGCLSKERTAQKMAALADELKGQRFGRLTVLQLSGERIHGTPAWECLCDCGNHTLAIAYQLKRGSKKSCGCLQKEFNDSQRIDHTEIKPGQRFGRPAENKINGAVTWECICDCGNMTLATEYWLKKGMKKSCGCLRKKTESRNLDQEKGPDPVSYGKHRILKGTERGTP